MYCMFSEGALPHFRAVTASPTLIVDFGFLGADHGWSIPQSWGRTTIVLLYKIGDNRNLKFEERGRGTPNDPESTLWSEVHRCAQLKNQHKNCFVLFKCYESIFK